MEIIDTKQASKELGVSASQIRKLLKQHDIGRRIGRIWVLTRVDMEQLKRVERKVGNPDFGTKWKGRKWHGE